MLEVIQRLELQTELCRWVKRFFDTCRLIEEIRVFRAHWSHPYCLLLCTFLKNLCTAFKRTKTMSVLYRGGRPAVGRKHAEECTR